MENKKKKFAEIVKAWGEGERIQHKYIESEDWYDTMVPKYNECVEFRVKPEEEKEIKPHIHCDVIKAWAEGEEIEVFDILRRKWVDSDNPHWNPELEYRVKPKVLDFDWSVLPCNADYAIALTAGGYWIATGKPKLVKWGVSWNSSLYTETISKEFYPKNFKGDWKESLHINPKYE